MAILNYNAKTEKETSRLWDKGKYQFRVLECKLTVNNNKYPGCDQLVLTLQLSRADGRKSNIFDTTIIHDDWAWKLRHFACAVGMEHEYMSNIFDPVMALDRCGMAMITVQAPSETYQERNIVQDYLPFNPDDHHGDAHLNSHGGDPAFDNNIDLPF